MSAKAFKARIRKGFELARERATHFREPRYDRGGGFKGWKIIEVTGPRHRANLIARGARPRLTSSEWREIYREVGLPQ